MDRLDKFLWALVLILIVAGITVVSIRFFGGDEDAWICQNNQWVKHGNPSAPMPTTACLSSDNQNLSGEEVDTTGGGAIEWSTALQLIKNCDVLRIAQTHNRNVDLWLKDGRQVWTTEPNLDDVLDEVQRANQCGTIPISTE